MIAPVDHFDPAGAPVRETAASGSLGRVLVVDKPRFSQLIRRMLDGRFNVVCVEDCLAALKAFYSHSPDVVIAELDAVGGGLCLAELLDMNMNVGHTPFILTCIQPQADLVERARKVGVDALLVKPFAPSTLVERISAAVRASAASAPDEEDEQEGVTDRIRARGRWIDGLPPFPDTHIRILRLAEIEEAVKKDFSEQVPMDPYFLENVLELANSLSDVFVYRVGSLRQAVTFAGFQQVADLVMCLHVFQELGAYKSTSKFDSMGFWKHSVGTAFIARTIAKTVKIDPEVSFMAGLFHDIGKEVMDRFFPEFFSQTLDVIQQQGIHSVEVEQDLLGINHAHLGGYLAVNWNFSDMLAEAIVCHHDPFKARSYPRLASAIHVANAICNHLSYGSSGEVVRQDPDDPALYKSLLKLGVGPHVLENLIELGEAQLGSADAFLSALMGGTPS